MRLSVFRQLVACVAVLCAAAQAGAAQVTDLTAAESLGVPAISAEYWLDASGTASAEAVLKIPGELFRPLRSEAYLGLKPGQAAWMRFSARSLDEVRWYLGVPDTRVERATLYLVDGSRPRESGSAGSAIAGNRWPIPQTYPLFPLFLDKEPRTFLLRLQTSDDLSVAPAFESELQMSRRQQTSSLVHGLYFGLVTLVVLFAWFCGSVFQDRAYVWLGAFAFAVNLVVARQVGIAGLHLWPNVPQWNQVAEHVASIFCMAPLLGFVAATVSPKARWPAVYWTLCALAGIALASSVVACYLPMPARVLFATVLVVGLAVIALATTVWARWLGDRFAGWLVVLFMPMLLALPFSIARWLQLVGQTLLTQHAIQVGLGMTLPSVLLLMMFRSQERSDYRRRISRLEQVDPLTGLVNDEVFEHRLRGLIHRSQRNGHASAAVVVEIRNFGRLGKEFGRKAVLEVMLRIAGRLTTLMRPMDTVARVGDNRYAVLMEGPVPADRCAQLGSTIMSRLVLPFSGLPKGLLLKPKIAVLAVPTHAATVQEAMQKLDALLKEAPPQDARNVYVLDSEPSSPLSAPT